MILIFVFLGSLFAGFFGLGALMVWTSVLMLAIKASLVVIAVLTVLLLFSVFRRR